MACARVERAGEKRGVLNWSANLPSRRAFAHTSVRRYAAPRQAPDQPAL